MATKFDVEKTTANFIDAINDPEVDMIKICTSHEAHLPIIEAASAKGKHIFCEKPMALEEAEAHKIIRAVRKSGVKLCVDLNRRMAPSMHALKRSWKEHQENPRHQPWKYVEIEREKFPEETKSHLLINIQDESSSYRLVHLDPLHGGGLILGETVHWLDLACWFFAPQVPVQIQAWGSARLSHGINLLFSDGDTATIIFSCCGTFDYPKEIYELSSGAALFRNKFFVENEYFGIPEKENERFPMQHDPFKETGEGFDAYMEKYKKQVSDSQNSKEKLLAFGVDKGHENMLDAFVEAILNDTPSPCDEIAGLESTCLAKLAIQSIERRQPLPVPIDKIRPAIV
jgi:predicted dehydrogenase